MQFRMTWLCTAVFSLSLLTLNAQQVYKSAHYGGPGSQYLYNRLFGFNQDTAVTKSGANVTWDLSGTTDLNTHVSAIVATDQAFDFFTFLTICALGGNNALQCSSVWANTQQAWLLQDSLMLFQFELADLQRYQRKTATRLFENFIGFKIDFGGFATPAVIVYNNPDTILHFPVTYGDQYTSSTHWLIDLSATGQNVKYESHQTRQTSIDSWGTLITPHQTFENVVRMRSLIHRMDSITTDSFSIPLDLTQVEYLWFDTLYKMPVMVANGIVNDTTEVLGTIEYIYDSTCATPTWTVSTAADTFYLDVNGNVTIDFTVNNGNADTYTWDWGDGGLENTTGSTSHTFSIPGETSVGITGCMTNCLPLNSCSFDVVDLVILDTLSSVQFLDAASLGIQLFPNPANDFITLIVPVHLDFTEYSIVDMTGRKVMGGHLEPGVNRFNIRSLAYGVYAIRLNREMNGVRQIATSRLAVIRD